MAPSVAALARATLLLVSALAARKRRRQDVNLTASTQDSAAAAVPVAVYSFGAPKVSETPLALRGGNTCMPGLRMENEDFSSSPWSLSSRDIVPWLGFMSFPKMATLVLGQNGKTRTEGCDWGGRWKPTKTSIDLHDKAKYIARASAVSSTLAAVAGVGLLHSYNTDIEYVARDVRGRGWGLVNSAVVPSPSGGSEVSHLMQNPSTLVCMLTFEGTDSTEDWVNNIDYTEAEFCGFQGVHKGFQQSLRNMVESEAFQANIRPQLSKCKEVQVLGHSLGGAMASLFASCAATAPLGNEAYEFVGWTPETAVKMPYL